MGATAEAQRAVYEDSLTHQSLSWMSRDNGMLEVGSDDELLLRDQAWWFNSVGVDLCFELHGMEADP